VARPADNRGKRSFIPTRKVRADRPCNLKSHTRGALRQLIGIEDHLAQLDPERFVWAGMEYILQQAKDRKRKVRYGPRVMFYALNVAKEFGLLTPAKRFRNGAERNGYLVADHDRLAFQKNGTCSLHAICMQTTCNLHANLSAVKGVPSAVKTASSAVPSAVNDTPECSPEWSTECSPELAEPFNSSNDAVIKLEICQENDGSLAGAKPIIPVIPKKRNQFKNDGSSFDDHDLADSTIANRLRTQPGTTPEETIRHVSDGEFNTAFFRKFPYPQMNKLVHAIAAAVEQMADEPYLGRQSNAKVMGRAMELLAPISVPKPWVKVMRKLRGKVEREAVAEAREPSRTDNQSSVFSSMWWPVLISNAEQEAGLQRGTLEASVTSGVLTPIAQTFDRLQASWDTGAQFMDAVVAELTRQGQPIPPAVATLQQHLHGRAQPKPKAEPVL
jgi:hypothetical protein